MANANQIKAGSAYVELTAKDGKLKAGLKSAESRLSRFGGAVKLLQTKLNATSKWFASSAKGINTASSGLMTFGGKVLGVATIVGGALAYAVKQAISMGDALDKMSKRTGASVEWLSAMGYAAEQGGASIDNVTDAIKGMHETIAEAKVKGTGEGYEWLRQLGLRLDDLEKLTTEEKFERIADSISKVEDHAIRTKAALGIFKGSAEKLLPVLPNIQKDKVEAKRLGLIVSSEQSKNATKLSDALTRLKSTMQMLVVQIGTALVPLTQRIAQTIAANIPKISDFVGKNQGLIVSLAKLIPMVAGAGLAITTLGTLLKPVSWVFTSLSVGAKFLSKSIGGIRGAFVAMGAGASYLVGRLQSVSVIAKSLPPIIGKIWGDTISGIGKLLKLLGQLGDAAKVAFKSIYALLVSGFKTIIAGSIKGFVGLLGMISTKALVITAGFLAVTAVVVTFWQDIVRVAKNVCAKIKTEISDLVSFVKGSFGNAISTVGRLFRDLGQIAVETWDVMLTAFSSGNLFGGLKYALYGAREMMYKIQLTIVEMLQNVLKFAQSTMWYVGEIAALGFLWIANKMQYIFRNAISGIAEFFDLTWLNIKNAGSAAIDYIGAAFMSGANMILVAFVNLFSAMKKMWLKTKGMFTDIDVDAEIKIVENEKKALFDDIEQQNKARWKTIKQKAEDRAREKTEAKAWYADDRKTRNEQAEAWYQSERKRVMANAKRFMDNYNPLGDLVAKINLKLELNNEEKPKLKQEIERIACENSYRIEQDTEHKNTLNLPSNLGNVMGSFQLRDLSFFGGGNDMVTTHQKQQIELQKRANRLLEGLAARRNKLSFG